MSADRAPWARLPWWILAALPPVIVIYFIGHYGVDVPFWDEWELVPLMTGSLGTREALRNLWSFRNEHRQPFPIAILLGLSRLTRWNVRGELFLNALLAALILAVLVLTGRRPREGDRAPGPPLATTALAVLVFAFGQWENWLWGITAASFTSVLACVLSFFLLSRDSRSGASFTGAVLSAVVASFSFGNGLLVWLAGLPALGCAPDPRRRVKRMLVWGLVAAATTGAYFHGFKLPRHRGMPALVTSEQPNRFGYVCTYLGAPLEGSDPARARALGEIGLVVWLAAGAAAVRRGADRTVFLPALSLGLLGVGTACATALVRAQLGPFQALSSRYVTLSTPFWASIVLLLAATAGVARADGRAAPLLRSAGIVVIVLLSMRNSIELWPQAVDRSDALATARIALRRERFSDLASDPRLRVLYPDPAALEGRVAALESHRLSLFRDRAR